MIVKIAPCERSREGQSAKLTADKLCGEMGKKYTLRRRIGNTPLAIEIGNAGMFTRH